MDKPKDSNEDFNPEDINPEDFDMVLVSRNRLEKLEDCEARYGSCMLWEIFLRDESEEKNLNDTILRVGINGLLKDFEDYLYEYKLIDLKKSKDHKAWDNHEY